MNNLYGQNPDKVEELPGAVAEIDADVSAGIRPEWESQARSD